MDPANPRKLGCRGNGKPNSTLKFIEGTTQIGGGRYTVSVELNPGGWCSFRSTMARLFFTDASKKDAQFDVGISGEALSPSAIGLQSIDHISCPTLGSPGSKVCFPFSGAQQIRNTEIDASLIDATGALRFELDVTR